MDNSPNCTIFYYCPEDPFNREPKKRLLNPCRSFEDRQPVPSYSSSRSSSASASPVSSSCDEYEDNDTTFHAEASSRKIRRKIRARDRDQEIDYLLKRRSLILQRKSSSNSSTRSTGDEANGGKISLSRQNSNTSNKNVRFLGDELNTQEKRHLSLSRQSSSTSGRSVRFSDNEHGEISHCKEKLSRQNSSSSCDSNSSLESEDSFSSNSNSCDITLSPYTAIQSSKMDTRNCVAKLAKQLKSNCDKILDMSVPFVIDSNLLWIITDAINELLLNNPNSDDIDEELRSQDEIQSSTTSVSGSIGDKRTNYEHDVMFLADFFEQTPSLCIVLSEVATIQGTIDITLFRSLQFLELRKIPLNVIAGINVIRVHLKKLKCTRCIDSLNEIFLFGESSHVQPSTSQQNPHSPNSSRTFDFSNSQQQPFSAALSTLTSVWPELREIDLSFNRIYYIDTKILELIPSVESLNLSRNRISSIDSSFTRVLNYLTILNLNYNQLTTIPPLPPNLKILLLSNNYISDLMSSFIASNFKSLEILDLSQNVISDEQQLEAFHQLSSLVSLSLIGNPVSYADSYRSTVSSNLNRSVLNNKQFVLDKKKLSNSEIRRAMESIKKRRPIISAGIFLTSRFHSEQQSKFNDIKSLTQSYDSNSSSIRTCRKKAKIREVVLLDDSDEENIENMSSSSIRTKKNNNEAKSLSPSPRLPRVTLERSNSNSSFQSVNSISPDEKNADTSVQDTKIAIESLREKYGADNWLLRQGGCEVKKLLGISESRLSTEEAELFSKSLPPQASVNNSFYSAVTNWDATTSFDETRQKGFPNSSPANTVTSNNSIEDNRSSTSTIAEMTKKQSINQAQENVSDESIKCIDDVNNSSESGIVYYSCTNIADETKLANDQSGMVFDNFDSKKFNETSPTFRFFQHGQAFNLIVENQYLYEVNPNQTNNVISKWDLKSIKSLSQEKNSSETGTVEFRLYFNTLKKHMKERSYFMTTPDYKNFESLIHPYLQKNAFEEDFNEGFQCIKCGAQFTKCLVTVKIIDKIPTTKHVCPNLECQSDLLVPLESIPLPGNESLNFDETTNEQSLEKSPTEKKSNWGDWGQLPFMRTSTPVSTNLHKTPTTTTPQSLPDHSFMSDIFKSPLNLISRPPLRRASNINPVSLLSPIFASSTANNANTCVPPTNNNGDELTVNSQNARSDSDVEVLSCDSSSIEVLAKDDENGSDVEAEEAVEIFVPDTAGQTGKVSAITGAVMMTESNSSGSFAESVCTTYEKVLGTNTTNSASLQPISQQLNLSPNSNKLSASTGSTSTTSISSSHTLTPIHPAATLNAAIPIKYDYQDFTKIDHRLRLFCEITVFKSRDEELLALTKALVLRSGTPYVAIIIFSNKKIYFYKVAGLETEKPDSWLQKKDCFPLSKLLRLDVLIGRQGVGIDFQGGKYFALVFRDARRTSNFFEFFLCDICTKIESPPIVQDLSQTQKALVVSGTKNISYFGILRFALCENSNKSYAVSAIVLTDDDLSIIVDLSWLISKTGNESVTVNHVHPLKTVRQVESLEVDVTFVRIVFQLDDNLYLNWELYFETREERDIFTTTLQNQIKEIPFITLSQPLEP